MTHYLLSRAGAALVLTLSLTAPARSATAPAERDILICASGSVSPELRKAVAEFTASAAGVPLFKALKNAGAGGAIKTRNSATLLAPEQYEFAAHNHLIVIGLASQDGLLQKVWGYTVAIDEQQQSLYALGWGYLSGSVGWIECDRNPFLHSQKIKSAPEGTILVKISGSTEAGVIAALAAFRQGQLGGFIPAGKITRPQTTILDRDPNPDPPPAAAMPPETLSVSGQTLMLAGWYDVPENEYRAIEDSSDGLVPRRIIRYKYLEPGIFEKPSIQRWLGGVHRMAFGNAINLARFASAREAALAVEKIAARDRFKKSAAGDRVWTLPIGSKAVTHDEVIKESYWTITLTASGPYLILSTLPAAETLAIAKKLR